MKRRKFLLALLAAPLAVPVIAKELSKVKEPTLVVHKTAAVGWTEELAKAQANSKSYTFNHVGYMNSEGMLKLIREIEIPSIKFS